MKITPRKHNDESGFTLIELLVVILIIGILSAIAIPAFMNQRKSASEASLKADLSNAAKSYETYAIKNKTYPADPATAGTKLSDGIHIVTPTSTTKTVAMRSAAKTVTINATWQMQQDKRGGGYSYIRVTRNTPTDDFFYAKFTGNCSDGTTKENTSGQPFGPSYSPGYWSGWMMRCDSSTAYVESFTIEKVNTDANQYPAFSEFETFTVSPVMGATDNVSPMDSKGFCIQGYHDADPTNYWKYSSIDGGLKQGQC